MKRTTASLVILFILVFGARADRFEHRFRADEKFRFLSTVEEDVYVNRRFSHSARILNRISFQTAQVYPDGSGLLRGEFLTSTRYEGLEAYVQDQQYQSEYRLAPNGVYDIAPKYYMPVVRNVPTFPDRDLSPGDTWSAPGEERHDFRSDFGLPEPFVIPFTASYTYSGRERRDGRDLGVIKVSYTIFHRPEEPKVHGEAFPTQIAGWSEQTLYWDVVRGNLAYYEESFQFVLEISTGSTIEFRGKARSEMIDAPPLDRAALEREIRDATEGLENVTVKSGEEGVTITIENIQFEADSARLRPEELSKLSRIADILKRYPDRDILVAGHTALAGTAEGRRKLSVERAAAVADRLIRLGARAADRVVVRGYGAERPLAPNTTEANKARNRRVEITILEN
jgi:outer membrane protein OmpA-like peptidoglycan-associated protein